MAYRQYCMELTVVSPLLCTTPILMHGAVLPHLSDQNKIL